MGVVGRMDPKLLERPQVFSGAPKDWRIWRIRFTSWLCGVDDRYEVYIPEAEQRGGPIEQVDASVKDLDRFLFIQLIGLVQGEYSDLLVEVKHAFEAWRKL